MVMYMFQCCSLNSPHLLFPLLCSQVCSLCLHLHCCSGNRIISTIFLDAIYMCINIYLVFSFWLNSLCIIGSRFIHLIRTGSNALFYDWVIVHHMYVPQHLYPFICWQTSGCSHVLLIVNSAAVKTGVYVSLMSLTNGWSVLFIFLKNHLLVFFFNLCYYRLHFFFNLFLLWYLWFLPFC